MDTDLGHHRAVIARVLHDLRTHQQAAVAGAEDAQVGAVGPVRAEQGQRRRVEVIEHVLLVELLALRMPVLAKFVAAADVGVGEHAAVLQPGQVGADEGRLDRDVETAVAVQNGGAGAVGRDSRQCQYGYRDPGAVFRDALDALRHHLRVIGRRLDLEHRLQRAGLAVVLDPAGRRGPAAVAEQRLARARLRGNVVDGDVVSGQRQAAHELRVCAVLLHPPVGAPAAHHQEALAQRGDALDRAIALGQYGRGAAVRIDGHDLPARRILERGNEEASIHPRRGAHVGAVIEHAPEMAAIAQEHLGRAAIADVGQYRRPRRGRGIHQHVFGHFRVVLAEDHLVGGNVLAEHVVGQHGVELLHRLTGRRRCETHVAEAGFVGVPRQSLRRGAAASPWQGIRQGRAAGHVEHMDGGQLAAAFGGAVSHVTAVRRRPVGSDRVAAARGIRVDQGFRRAVRPRLRDQHGLRLWRGLLQVEQGAAGQHRAGARGRGDRQLLHPGGERLALRHRRQFRFGVRVLRLDPALHRRRVGMLQPAVGIGHADAMDHAGIVAAHGRRRQQRRRAQQGQLVRRVLAWRRRQLGGVGHTGREQCKNEDKTGTHRDHLASAERTG